MNRHQNIAARWPVDLTGWPFDLAEGNYVELDLVVVPAALEQELLLLFRVTSKSLRL